MQAAPDVEVAGQYLGEGGGVKWAGSGWVDGRVRFPPFAWKLLTAATQPLPPQAGALYIVLMLLFSCLADGRSAAAKDRFASDSPDSLARDQVQGARRNREGLC